MHVASKRDHRLMNHHAIRCKLLSIRQKMRQLLPEIYPFSSDESELELINVSASIVKIMFF